MTTMKYDHELHLKCGALLLTAFKKFRNNSWKNYGLWPNHNLIAPTLSWDVMLIMTKVKLELISDPSMYLFFKKGMRSGDSSQQ